MEDILSDFIGFTMLTAVIFLFKAAIQTIAKTKELREKQSDGVNNEPEPQPPSPPLTEEEKENVETKPLTEEEKAQAEKDNREMFIFKIVFFAMLLFVALCVLIAYLK